MLLPYSFSCKVLNKTKTGNQIHTTNCHSEQANTSKYTSHLTCFSLCLWWNNLIINYSTSELHFKCVSMLTHETFTMNSTIHTACSFYVVIVLSAIKLINVIRFFILKKHNKCKIIFLYITWPYFIHSFKAQNAVISNYQKCSKEGQLVNQQWGHGCPRLIDAHGEWQIAHLVWSLKRATVAQIAK